MIQTLRTTSNTDTKNSPASQHTIEAQLAALEPLLNEAAADLLSPSAKALEAVLKEASRPS